MVDWSYDFGLVMSERMSRTKTRRWLGWGTLLLLASIMAAGESANLECVDLFKLFEDLSVYATLASNAKLFCLIVRTWESFTKSYSWIQHKARSPCMLNCTPFQVPKSRFFVFTSVPFPWSRFCAWGFSTGNKLIMYRLSGTRVAVCVRTAGHGDVTWGKSRRISYKFLGQETVHSNTHVFNTPQELHNLVQVNRIQRAWTTTGGDYRLYRWCCLCILSDLCIEKQEMWDRFMGTCCVVTLWIALHHWDVLSRTYI